MVLAKCIVGELGVVKRLFGWKVAVLLAKRNIGVVVRDIWRSTNVAGKC